MEKKSIIKKAEFKREFIGKSGSRMYVISLVLENGDIGSSFSTEKEPAALSVGKEISYTIDNDTIRIVKQRSFPGEGRAAAPSNLAGFAMAYSKDILCANWSDEKASTKLKTSDMFNLAEKMFAWMKERQ